MSDPREVGVDLSSQQDVGFSLSSITRRDGGRVNQPDQEAEVEAVAGEVASFAASKGLGFAVSDTSSGQDGETISTTFLLGERIVNDGVRRSYELTIDIRDKRAVLTSDGLTSRNVELRIGPHRPPYFAVIEQHATGTGSYAFEASVDELKAVLGSLKRGSVDTSIGSVNNPRVPSWRSLARRTSI